MTGDAPWRGARQLVLVTVPHWDADRGTLRAWERDGSGWHAVGAPSPVVIGRAGAAWGLGLHPTQPSDPVKREGDGRAPAGVFAIGQAFGYAPGPRTALPYTAMQASHYCIDVVGSPLYDQIVDAHVVGANAITGSTEPMRRDLHADGDQRYKLGFVVEHNPRNTQGAGSCIFAHLWKSPDTPTAGCTAMAETTMQALLAWLRPDRRPVFVLLPDAEYARLQVDWQLPALDAQP
ncbi:MAG: hypothetical protein LC715_04195 [Gammaproteobacteria bacterium]|nr:hypothetical protein [Gammaproteobacteria bacterium]